MADQPIRRPTNPWKVVSGVLLFVILWSGFSDERVYLADGMAVLKRSRWWGIDTDEFTIGTRYRDEEPRPFSGDVRWFYRGANGWRYFEVVPYVGDPTGDGPNR